MARMMESPGVFRARLLFTFVQFVVLILLAHGGAELAGWIDSGAGPTVLHYRAVFTLWVTIVLLTLALCAYIFLRPGERNGYWLGFWTTSYLAFLCHLCWLFLGETRMIGKLGLMIE